jgi:hypothetical protein
MTDLHAGDGRLLILLYAIKYAVRAQVKYLSKTN